MQPKNLIAHFALFAVALFYGANYYIAKSVMPEPIAPTAFIVLRVSGALVLFLSIFWFRREKIDKKDFGRFILCGLTGVAFNQLMFFKGLEITSLSNASIIMTINPILVLIMSSVILKQKPNGRKKIGILFGAIGAIALIVLSSKNIGLNNSSVRGDLYILINATSYAIYLVTVKPLMAKYKPLTVISIVFAIGFIFVLPFGINSAMEIPWQSFSEWQYFSVIYVVLITTFLAYLLNIYALSKVQPTVASSYIYLQPVMAILFAWIFSQILDKPFNQELTWYKTICALLIFIGIFLVSKEKKKQLS